MKDYKYPVIITVSDDKSKLNISFPDFPNAEIELDNPDYLAEKELAMNIALLKFDKKPLPKPSDPKNFDLMIDTQTIKHISTTDKFISQHVQVKKLF